MSQQNVERLRTFWDTWNPGEPLDMSLVDPEATYEDTILPDHVGEVYRGQEGLARAVERWLEVWDELTLELEQIIGTGDRLVSVHRTRGRMRYTGMEFEGPLAYAWTFRNGKVIHLQSFFSKQEALEAVGLRE
jgi:ketosteroid isomerase-like protein